MEHIILTTEELDLLMHFVILGQNAMINRNAQGDREVAKELDPVLLKVWKQAKI